MNVLILAAGFGTRLYPLTQNIPKALIKINNQPVIEYALNKNSKLEGIEEICIVSNNKFCINFLEWLSEFRKNNKIAEKIRIINNKVNTGHEKKGAVGDLKFVTGVAGKKDSIILAADNLFDFDLQGLVNLSSEKKSSSVALKVINDTELVKKYSCVLLDSDNKLTFFEEKPKNPRSNICKVACYFFTKDDLEKIENHNFENMDNMGDMIDFLYKESGVYGKIFEEFWCDIGSLQEIEKAEEYFKQKD
jgi:glucose-1-phosphate thymidylyltransferase